MRPTQLICLVRSHESNVSVVVVVDPLAVATPLVVQALLADATEGGDERLSFLRFLLNAQARNSPCASEFQQLEERLRDARMLYI